MSFRQDKLAALLSYLASRSADDEHFSVVKAAKLVTFIDFASYVRYGDSVTGSQIIKLKAGPVPRQFEPTLNLLRAKGELDVRRRLFKGRQQKRILATPTAKWEALTERELRLADEFFERHLGDKAVDVRDLSHELPGWALVNIKQRIPFHTAFITLDGPTAQDYADGEALATRLGWV